MNILHIYIYIVTPARLFCKLFLPRCVLIEPPIYGKIKYMKKHLRYFLIAILCGVAAGLVYFGFAKLKSFVKRSGPLTESEVASVLGKNEYPSETERIAVTKAVSLLGRVKYFWGGKYNKPGECPEWGELRTVTSDGSSSSGSERPFGLDCSGFVTWSYVQAGVSPADIGEGTWNQWMLSRGIDKSELRPGDLGFTNKYPGSSGNHIGVCIGYYKDKPVFIHCSNVYDTVVVTYSDGVFNYFRRPFEGEQDG